MRLFRRAARTALAAATVAASVLLPAAPASAAGITTGISVTQDGLGYATVTDDGIVRTYGYVAWRGNPTGFSGNIVDIAVTREGDGYVAISSRGQVYAYGNVTYRGNVVSFPGDVTGIDVTADGKGYVAVTTTGHIYAFGTVPYRGGLSGHGGTNPVTAVSLRPDGQGYAIATARGDIHLYNILWRDQPSGFTGDIVDVAVTSSGEGYLAISSAGQVYGFNVPWRGNPSGFTGGISGVAVTPDGGGYIAVSGTNQRYAYGKVSYGGASAPAGQHQNGNVAAYWSFGAGGSSITHLDQEIMIEDKAPHSFWANQFTWTTGENNYMGLQVDGDRFDGTIGETAFFSIWGATESRGAHCGTFWEFGPGRSCRLPFTFETYNRYRLRVVRLEMAPNGEWWWRASIRSTVPSGTEQVIGDLRAPLGKSAIGSMLNFSEYWGPAVSARHLVPKSIAEFHAPKANLVTGSTYAATGTYGGGTIGSGTTGSYGEVTYGDGSKGARLRLGG